MPFDDNFANAMGISARDPSPWTRLAESATNLPSEAFNTFTGAAYNLGFRLGDQTEPVKAPDVFNLAPPEGLGEKAVDYTSAIAAQIPAIMAGEGAVGAIGKAAELPALLTRIARPAVGFGLAGLAESPEGGATSGALGAAFGAAEAAPLPIKAVLAGGIGAASAYQDYQRSHDPTEAALMGGVNAILPFLFGKQAKKPAPTGGGAMVPYTPPVAGGVPAAAGAGAAAGPGPFTGMGFPTWYAHGFPRPPVRATVVDPALMNGQLALEAGTRPAALPWSQPEGALTRIPATVDNPMIPFMPRSMQQELPMQIGRTAPEGSLIRTAATAEPTPPNMLTAEPTMTPAELRRGMGVRPPPGSLIRDPLFTSGEVARGMRQFIPQVVRESELADTRPPIQPSGAANAIGTIAKGGEAATPITVAGKAYSSEQEALDAVTSLLPKRTPVPEPVVSPEVTPTTEPPLNKSRRLTLSTVLHPSDPEMLQKATEKLGLVAGGDWGPQAGLFDVKVPIDAYHKASFGANISIKYGDTFKDLKNKVNAKEQQFLEGESQYPEKKAERLARLAEKESGAAAPPTEKPIATLQQAEAAIPEETPPSTPETTPTIAASGEAQPPATGGKPTGQIVLAEHPSGEIVSAKIVGPSPEIPGQTRVRMSDGTEFDVHPKRIQALPSRADIIERQATKESSRGDTVTYGTIDDLNTLREQNYRKGGRFGKPSAGETGAVPYDAEIAMALGKYLFAPIVAGTVTYAKSDPDLRMRNALEAAMGTAAAMYFGPRALALLLKAHPDISPAAAANKAKRAGLNAAAQATAAAAAKKNAMNPKSWVGAMFGDLAKFGRALVGDEAMAAAGQKSGQATGLERMAAWIDAHFVRGVAQIRLTQAAKEQAQIVAEQMHNAMSKINAAVLSPTNLKTIGEYFAGRIDDAELMRLIPDKNIHGIAQNIVVAKEALTDIILNSLDPKSKLYATIKNNVDNYLTTSYRLFHDPTYFPSPQQIGKVADELLSAYQKDDPFLTRAGLSEMIDKRLKELKVNKNLFTAQGGYGASIGAILKEKKNLSPAFKDMLGIYDNPLDAMVATELKLIRGAHNASVIGSIADAVGSDGMKFAMSAGERDSLLAKLDHQIKMGGLPPDKIAALQEQRYNLSLYDHLGDEARFGKLRNMFVERKMYQSLQTFDAPNIWNESPLARSISNINNFVKKGHTLYSPLQFTRQVFSIPMLGILAKTTPLSWYKALKVINEGMRWKEGMPMTPGVQEFFRLRRAGIISNSDFVGGVLRQDATDFLKNGFDLNPTLNANIFKRGLRAWSEIYRVPDLIPRVAAFQSEEARLLKFYGSTAGATEKALQGGVEYANRYTVNYGAAPSGIQLLRRLPFFNQYLTFAFEVARVTKNLMEDVVKRRDPGAALALTTLGLTPIIIQRMSEAALSPKDREDWDKVKNLAPSYSRSNFKIVTGRLPNGNFHYFDFTPLIIHDKWMKMVRDAFNGDGWAALADNPVIGWNNTPLINVVTNQVAGRDIHTQEKLRTVSSRLDSVRRDLGPTLIGTDWDRFGEALTRNTSGGLGVMSAKTGRETSLGSMLGSYATAVRGYSVNPNYMMRQAIFDAKDSMDSERMMMNRIVQTNANYEVRSAAVARFNAAAKEIQQGLREKLGFNPDLQTAPSF